MYTLLRADEKDTSGYEYYFGQRTYKNTFFRKKNGITIES